MTITVKYLTYRRKLGRCLARDILRITNSKNHDSVNYRTNQFNQTNGNSKMVYSLKVLQVTNFTRLDHQSYFSLTYELQLWFRIIVLVLPLASSFNFAIFIHQNKLNIDKCKHKLKMLQSPYSISSKFLQDLETFVDD